MKNKIQLWIKNIKKILFENIKNTTKNYIKFKNLNFFFINFINIRFILNSNEASLRLFFYLKNWLFTLTSSKSFKITAACSPFHPLASNSSKSTFLLKSQSWRICFLNFLKNLLQSLGLIISLFIAFLHVSCVLLGSILSGDTGGVSMWLCYCLLRVKTSWENGFCSGWWPRLRRLLSCLVRFSRSSLPRDDYWLLAELNENRNLCDADKDTARGARAPVSALRNAEVAVHLCSANSYREKLKITIWSKIERTSFLIDLTVFLFMIDFKKAIKIAIYSMWPWRKN